ncbi:NAD(P)-binding domain-containing protein [Leptospira sp. GIMC2001]|uniref:NAD(P)-binding domain-containing protein n=1 Tax=Leptospira sp. GIMC2001 TaxID=1513297 RepID=UPI00234B077A|nr:NAD(P)-binding domain-containing protein [Leptospira sp. GIMC2001]WCL49385.1 glutamyl-tRNA reductase [Leptospira sp. GIMC2001]
MWNNLVLLHSNDPNRSKIQISGFEDWNTCLRTIYISDSRIVERDSYENLANYDSYFGMEAYQFLLELVTGLHSKLFGESEIQAQFRDRFSNENINRESQAFGFLQKLRDDILKNARSIRSQYLTGHGRTTYGGIADSLLPRNISVSLIGTGKLAESIIVHLLKKNRAVQVVGRDPQNLERFKLKYKVSTCLWEDYEPSSSSMVVCAPVPITDWINRMSDDSIVLDFRGEVSESLTPTHIQYISLLEIMDTIRGCEENIKNLHLEILSKIEEIINGIKKEQIHIPHGWDDLICLTR